LQIGSCAFAASDHDPPISTAQVVGITGVQFIFFYKYKKKILILRVFKMLGD
jgi:hypothetical protein